MSIAEAVRGARLRPARGMPWWVPGLLLAPVLLPGRAPRVAAGAVVLGVLSFFRDPDRTPATGSGDGTGDETAVLAAADGRIREVAAVDDGRWLVSTYLSLRDVHVTRSPWAGTVVRQDHRPGGYRQAFRHESVDNERVVWDFATPLGDARLTQFAGLLARRIVPYVPAGAVAARGERIGLIRFGSRVDLHLPAGFTPTVSVGDRAVGGRTVVAVRNDGATR